MRLAEIDLLSDREEYLCKFSVLRNELVEVNDKQSLQAKIANHFADDSEMVIYLVSSVEKTLELLSAIKEENSAANPAFVSCYLENMWYSDIALESRTCPAVCASERELCYSQAANRGMGVFSAGSTTAGGILSYGWYTGTPAGIGAAGTFIGGIIGGVVTTGVGWYNCDLAYDFCCMNGGGANNQPLTKKCP